MRAFAGGLGLAAAMASCSGTAIAADLPLARIPVAPVASAPAAIYTWTGLYIGGQIGGVPAVPPGAIRSPVEATLSRAVQAFSAAARSAPTINGTCSFSASRAISIGLE
jgi:hypothetical protein